MNMGPSVIRTADMSFQRNKSTQSKENMECTAAICNAVMCDDVSNKYLMQ